MNWARRFVILGLLVSSLIVGGYLGTVIGAVINRMIPWEHATMPADGLRPVHLQESRPGETNPDAYIEMSDGSRYYLCQAFKGNWFSISEGEEGRHGYCQHYQTVTEFSDFGSILPDPTGRMAEKIECRAYEFDAYSTSQGILMENGEFWIRKRVRYGDIAGYLSIISTICSVSIAGAISLFGIAFLSLYFTVIHPRNKVRKTERAQTVENNHI
jgi:hypothetical protein